MRTFRIQNFSLLSCLHCRFLFIFYPLTLYAGGGGGTRGDSINHAIEHQCDMTFGSRSLLNTVGLEKMCNAPTQNVQTSQNPKSYNSDFWNLKFRVLQASQAPPRASLRLSSQCHNRYSHHPVACPPGAHPQGARTPKGGAPTGAHPQGHPFTGVLRLGVHPFATR